MSSTALDAMIFKLRGIGDLPNGAVVTLGFYYPARDRRHDEEWTRRVLRLKGNHDDAVDFFTSIMDEIVGDAVAIAVVPSSQAGKLDIHGITRVAKRLAERRVDATTCIVRHKTISKLAFGGKRDRSVHEDSLRVENRDAIFGREVLIIDDVVTSGNSLAVCAELLLKEGASRVNCLTASRTWSPSAWVDSTEKAFRTYAESYLRRDHSSFTLPQQPTRSPFFSPPEQPTRSPFFSPPEQPTRSPFFSPPEQPTRSPFFSPPPERKSLLTPSSTVSSKPIGSRSCILFDFDLTIANTVNRPKRWTEAFRLDPTEAYPLYPGIIRTVRRLVKSGKVLGVVTSSPGDFCEKVLRAWNIWGSFQVVVGYHDTEKHKPDPEPVRLALSRCGAVSGDAVFVGDHNNDILAGRNAGAMTVAANWHNPASALRGDHTVTSVGELLLLLTGRSLNEASSSFSRAPVSTHSSRPPSGGPLFAFSRTTERAPLRQRRALPPSRFDRSVYRSSVLQTTAMYACPNGHNTYVDVRDRVDEGVACSQCLESATLQNIDEWAI